MSSLYLKLKVADLYKAMYRVAREAIFQNSKFLNFHENNPIVIFLYEKLITRISNLENASLTKYNPSESPSNSWGDWSQPAGQNKLHTLRLLLIGQHAKIHEWKLASPNSIQLFVVFVLVTSLLSSREGGGSVCTRVSLTLN